MKAYARQAQDKQLVIDASEIQIRAERRLGEMIRMQKETVGLNGGIKMAGRNNIGGIVTAPPNNLPTLADVGISKRLSSRSQAKPTGNDLEPVARPTLADSNSSADWN